MVVGRDDIDKPPEVFDVEVYDGMMYHFNRVMRTSVYTGNTSDAYLISASEKIGMDRCFDCTSLRYLVGLYNQLYDKKMTVKDVTDAIPTVTRKLIRSAKMTRDAIR
jgi:hypothetical protein